MSSINPADRKTAELLISRWFAGEVTNYEFDDEWPYESPDHGVVDIGRELWLHYTDFPKVKLTADDLTTEEAALLKRCLVFLGSSENYEAVPVEAALPSKPRLITKLFGRRQPPWEAMRLVVDEERQKWWPFADEAQWRKVAGQT